MGEVGVQGTSRLQLRITVGKHAGMEAQVAVTDQRLAQRRGYPTQTDLQGGAVVDQAGDMPGDSAGGGIQPGFVSG
ncbi:hypothetical protein D9M69_680550 [compost metagenome]